MTPAARLQAAIDVLAAWQAGREGLDRVLARWGRANRYAGAKDRQAIADITYDALRRPRSRQWLAGAGDPGPALEALAPRAVVLAGAALVGEDLASMLAGARHGPAPLSDAERAAFGEIGEAAARLAEAPAGVRFDMPEWLLEAFGPVPAETALAIAERAPLYLRANALKGDRAAAAEALAGEGVATEPGPLSPTCLRVVSGARGVTRTAAFAEGLVEVQDAASQAAADLAQAAPGMTVLDFCAGGGGKTLALGAAMAGQGRLIAHDIDPRRMADLPARAGRAGLTVELADRSTMQSLKGRCDLVFADAPCSGSGAWRRNPDARWRLRPDRLATLVETQDTIIDRALAFLAPGGRLVFATCSFLPVEGEDRVAALAARRPGIRPEGRRVATLPTVGGPDGFFAVRLGDSSA